MTRIFISIDIPENIQQEIEKIQNRLPEFAGKKTEIENLHLTLKFLGEISKEEIEKIRKRLKEIKFSQFETSIDELGVFSEKFVRIVWLHLSNCEEIQKIIDEKLSGSFSKEKRFMSHLTIARVKRLDNKGYFSSELKKIKIPRIGFVVDSFRLKKSTLTPKGPVYETLEEYFLKKRNIN